MTVEQFVARRRDGWRRLGDLSDRLAAGPQALSAAEIDEFGRLYRQAASDLAYAADHLDHLELQAWLNRLVVRAHGLLYGERPRTGHRLVAFWRGYPARWRAARPFLLGATLTFGLAVAVAWVAVVREPRQAGLFVPVEVTAQLRPEADGRIPVAAFAALSSLILAGNLTAALICFSTGLFFGLGTIASLLKNGFLLGALAGLTQAESPASLVTFAALTLPHGLLEIAALLTCAAAGLKLGWALLHGGPSSRAEALRQAGREAIELVLGCLPWFATAALVEGFLTPLPAPPSLKILVGLLLGGALAGYLSRGSDPELP